MVGVCQCPPFRSRKIWKESRCQHFASTRVAEEFGTNPDLDSVWKSRRTKRDSSRFCFDLKKKNIKHSFSLHHSVALNHSRYASRLDDHINSLLCVWAPWWIKKTINTSFDSFTRFMSITCFTKSFSKKNEKHRTDTHKIHACSAYIFHIPSWDRLACPGILPHGSWPFGWRQSGLI